MQNDQTAAADGKMYEAKNAKGEVYFRGANLTAISGVSVKWNKFVKNDPTATVTVGAKLVSSWCKCASPSDQGAEPDFIFSENGQCLGATGCGMNHHHYHCTNCGAILQVG